MWSPLGLSYSPEGSGPASEFLLDLLALLLLLPLPKLGGKYLCPELHSGLPWLLVDPWHQADFQVFLRMVEWWPKRQPLAIGVPGWEE